MEEEEEEEEEDEEEEEEEEEEEDVSVATNEGGRKHLTISGVYRCVVGRPSSTASAPSRSRSSR